MSMAPDYLVEVRDRNFVRLGQIDAPYLDLKFVEVFRSVGAWEMKLPAEHPLLPHLKTKGSGIVITHVPSGHVFSGRMRSCVLSQAAEDPDGTWVITGVDDNVVAAATVVLPDPASEPDAQTAGYWNFAGTGEAVMKAAVSLNVGPGALASRSYPWLSVATSLGRGTNVSTSSRFHQLGDTLTALGIASGLGWRFAQQGTGVVFDVFAPTDKTGLIQLDIRNGGIESTELGFSAPSATEVLVLGQGQGAERTVRRVTSTAATAEAEAWGLRWEASKDQRQTDDPDELQQAGEEVLTEAGQTLHSLKVVPSDAPNQRLGVDWGLGDLVKVIIDGTPADAIVTEIATSISSAGIIKTATVGDPVGFDWEAKIGTRVREHETRLSNLENLVDTRADVVWTDIGNRPTTFPPSAHTHDDRYFTETEINTKLDAINTRLAPLEAQRTNFTAFHVTGTAIIAKSGAASYTPIVLSVAKLNYGGDYNTTTGGFTAPVAGVYRFDFSTTQAGTVTGGPEVALYKNGVAIVPNGAIGYFEQYMTFGFAAVVQLDAGDVIKVYWQNNNGVTAQIDLTRTQFSGHLLHQL